VLIASETPAAEIPALDHAAEDFKTGLHPVEVKCASKQNHDDGAPYLSRSASLRLPFKPMRRKLLGKTPRPNQ
jgi:hypothetical protein